MENLKLNSKKRDEPELENLTKEELITKIKCMEAHNNQLKNIIAKSNKNYKKIKHKQKPFDFSKANFRHVLLKFYYLGWDYHGFAIQEDTSNTIEYHLFDALIRTCLIKDRESSNYHRCGRTDKGVSAFSQVISIDLRSKFSKEKQGNVQNELEYCKLINRVLPHNIQCVCWCPITDEFSARFDCKRRTYKYFFPLGDLNIEAMNTALSYLIGSHDFRNFCKMDVANGVVSFLRNIISGSIEKLPGSSHSNVAYDMCQLTLTGKAFLWHQVRCIVGVLFLIGGNKEKPEVIKELLDVEKNPRKPEYNMASEVALNLFYCEYDGIEDWVYDYIALSEVIAKLQAMWTINETKSVMMKSMLDDLEGIYDSKSENVKLDFTALSNCLIQGIKPKMYKPLMDRQKCEGLEDRIQHFIRKRRLIVTDSDEQSSKEARLDES